MSDEPVYSALTGKTYSILSCSAEVNPARDINWSNYTILINGIGTGTNPSSPACAEGRTVERMLTFDTGSICSDTGDTENINVSQYGHVFTSVYDVTTIQLTEEDQNNGASTLLKYCQWTVWITTNANGDPIVEMIVGGLLQSCPAQENSLSGCCSTIGAECVTPTITFTPV